MLKLPVPKLVPISKATLFFDAMLGMDIYASTGSEGEAKLFCAKDTPFNKTRLLEISENGRQKLYLDADCNQAYQAYLRDHWDEIADNRDLPLETRTSVMSEVVRDVLSGAFYSGNTAAIVEASQSLGDGIVKILSDEKIVLSELCAVLHHDYATFTHSANVAFYAVLLAKNIGYSLAEQNQIAIGALLHDLGKLSVAERILTKPGRLDELEFKEVKRHPGDASRTLSSRRALNHAQLMMAYQHHEKLDGSGYPVGLLGHEIHPWAKLCTVVDIFEALTSTRPYRSSTSHKVALSILVNAAEKELDTEIVSCWSKLVSKE